MVAKCVWKIGTRITNRPRPILEQDKENLFKISARLDELQDVLAAQQSAFNFSAPDRKFAISTSGCYIKVKFKAFSISPTSEL